MSPTLAKSLCLFAFLALPGDGTAFESDSVNLGKLKVTTSHQPFRVPGSRPDSTEQAEPREGAEPRMGKP